MTATPTLLADPEMEATHFGIPVSYYGEDDCMIALGHHSKRRALAAFNRHARTLLGLASVSDDPESRAVDWLDAICERWAIFTAPDNPTEYPDGFWFVQFTDGEQPGALPVTVLIP
ncbi:hypothetical protein [Streptomyces sp. NPDC056105]|uniref:hypothetical protein n=1 Tax=Streptomyces sp. NPDC056105 TaxID=3345714 RepID=UPI0035DF986E